MPTMRHIAHPGIPDSQRIFYVPTSARSLQGSLSTGQTLLSAVSELSEMHGVKSGAFTLNGGAFDSFSYVMPALSKSPEHAVYFSDTFFVEGQVKLETAAVTYGLKEGRPWLHSHAVWIEPGGRRHCGHLLPDQIIVAAPIQLSGIALDTAAFTVCPDAETNFSLFMPVGDCSQVPRPKTSTTDHQTAYALRLAPNIDFCSALEDFCRAHDIERATIFGGVGSTVGAVFQDARVVEPFVTELLIRSGRIVCGPQGQACAELDVSMVDYKGGISEGRLARGVNPILVTAELVICPN
jgi:predicted DNA-binding protein with PD1-like motif